MILIVISFVLITCIYFWRRRALVKCYKNLPPTIPGALPVLGHSLLLVSYGDVTHLWSLIKKYANIITSNGGIMTGYMGQAIYFVITDPNDSAILANAYPDKYHKYDFLKTWLGEGLLTSSGETWKRHRKYLNPAFSQQVLNSFIDIFNVQAKLLTNNLEDKVGKAPFNPVDYSSNTSLETIYQTAMGINTEKCVLKNKNEYLDTVKEMLYIVVTRMQTIWLHSEFIYKWSTFKKQEDISLKIIKDTFTEIMNYKKATKEMNESSTGMKYQAFLDLLLEYSAVGHFSSEEVKDEVNTILVTGHETTSTCLVNTLLFLGSYPDIQNKVYKELKEVFDSSLKDVDKEDLAKLIYLEAVINESLRLCPMAPIIVRDITHDTKLSKYTLPAGSNCVLLLYGLHRHPVWGADADQFRPERWLESPAPPRNAFAGFGLGKRNCIGKNYAMMFMKTILAHILRRYKVTADISEVTYKVDLILKPHTGCLIAIDERTT